MSTRSASRQREGREIPRDEWRRFFDRLDRRLQDDREEYEAAVEIDREDAAESEGVEAQPIPLAGMSWEDADDVIAVELAGRGGRFPVALRHFVPQPRRLIVDDDAGMPSTITVVSADGARTVVTLRRAVGRV